MNKGLALIPIVLIVLLLVIVGIVFSTQNILIQKKVNDPTVSTETKVTPTYAQEEADQELPSPVGEYSLPPGIHEAQIKKTYQFGDVYYALVLRPSMNIFLRDLPNDAESFFAGVLTANRANGTWEKIWEIKDGKTTQKNNPYHMWLDNERLILAIVNQNGAGSGEGLMTLVDINSSPDPKIIGCYYFGGDYGQPSTHGDYFEYTERLDEQEPRDISDCENWNLMRVQ